MATVVLPAGRALHEVLVWLHCRVSSACEAVAMRAALAQLTVLVAAVLRCLLDPTQHMAKVQWNPSEIHNRSSERFLPGVCG